MSSIRSILEEAFYKLDKHTMTEHPDADLTEKCRYGDDLIDQALKDISELIDGVIMSAISVNQHGQFEDDGGNICWYLDDLEKALRNNLKELLK